MGTMKPKTLRDFYAQLPSVLDCTLQGLILLYCPVKEEYAWFQMDYEEYLLDLMNLHGRKTNLEDLPCRLGLTLGSRTGFITIEYPPQGDP